MTGERITVMPPERVKVWFCPACGAIVTGANYRIDSTRSKCVKKTHRAMAISYWYRRDRMSVPEPSR